MTLPEIQANIRTLQRSIAIAIALIAILVVLVFHFSPRLWVVFLGWPILTLSLFAFLSRDKLNWLRFERQFIGR